MTTPDYAHRDQHAAEDRDEAAKKWMRGYVRFRGVFVQNPQAGENRNGPLADFVTKRQHRALLLYLMLLSVWPWLRNENIPLEAHVWMNLLHSRSGDGRSLVWSESTLSRTWKYLAENGYIQKAPGRKGHLWVQPRLENASGPYTFPEGGKDWNEVYFTLPDRFWLEEDFAKLTLPGLALLLVIAKETNKTSEIRITQEQLATWYGFSRGTVAKGLDDLRRLDLIAEREVWIPAKLSKIRTTRTTYFSLVGDYSTEARAKARANAERRRRRVDRALESGVIPTFISTESEDPSDK